MAVSLPPVPESISFSSVTPVAVAAFQQDGATCIRQAFTRAQMALLAEGIEQSMAAPSSHGQFLKGEKGEGRFFNDYCKWKSIPAFEKIVYESPAAELAAKLMESKKAIFYHEHVLVKEPDALKATPWHHDQSYYPIDGDQLCSFWVPVDPVDMETTLQFVAGSHQWGWFVPRMFSDAVGYDEARKVEMPEGSRPLSSYRPVPDIEAQRDRFQFLSWSLEPGDVIAFHGRVLHAASGNSSQIPRRVVSLRWVGDDARLAARPWLASPPITGGLKLGDAMACEEFPEIKF